MGGRIIGYCGGNWHVSYPDSIVLGGGYGGISISAVVGLNDNPVDQKVMK